MTRNQFFRRIHRDHDKNLSTDARKVRIIKAYHQGEMTLRQAFNAMVSAGCCLPEAREALS